MKQVEQAQQVELTAQPHTAYSGVGGDTMAEPQVEQPNPSRFRRAIHKLRRRKPQQQQRPSDAAEDEKRRKEREAEEQRIQEQQRQLADAIRLRSREILEREQSPEFRREVAAASAELRREGRAAVLEARLTVTKFPSEEIRNSTVRRLVDGYNKGRDDGQKVSSGELRSLREHIARVLSDESEYPPGPESLHEQLFIQNEILEPLEAFTEIQRALEALPQEDQQQGDRTPPGGRSRSAESVSESINPDNRRNRSDSVQLTQLAALNLIGLESLPKVTTPVRLFTGEFDATNPYVSADLARLEEEVRQGIAQSSDILHSLTADQQEELRSRVTTQILRPVRAEFLRVKLDEAQQAQDAAEERQQNHEKSQERTNRGSFLAGITNDEGEPVDYEDILGSRTVRDKAFDKIFAAADAKAYKFWDRAFDQLNDGMILNSFHKFITYAAQDVKQIPDRAAYIFIKNLRKRGEDHDWLHGIPDDVNERSRLDDALRERLLLRAKKEIQKELEADHLRYQLDEEVKETLHNANAVIEKPNVNAEQLYGFIDGFSSEIIDYVWRTPGLREMMNIYEEQVRRVSFENDGYVPPEKIKRSIERLHGGVDGDGDNLRVIIPEIDEKSIEQFTELMNKGGIFVRSDRVDDPRTFPRKFEEWEIKRLLLNARGMMVLQMRMLSLAAENKIPLEGRYTSMFLQDVIQNYSPYTHLLWKYHVPSDKALAMLLIEPDRDKMLFGTARKPWATKHLMHVKHVLESGETSKGSTDFENPLDDVLNDSDKARRLRHGRRQVLEGHMGEMLQIRRSNPGFCGDYAGFLGWRAGQDPIQYTGAQRFLENGLHRMKVRWEIEGSGAKRYYDDFIDKRDGEEIRKTAERDRYDRNDPAQRERYEDADKKLREYLNDPKEKKRRAEINRQLRDYQNEYSNWIGTGLRFERMRGDLLDITNKMEDKSSEGKARISDSKERDKITAAENLLERIAELQPQRLFLKSYKMQKRFDGALLDGHHGNGGGHAGGGFDAQGFPGRFQAIEGQVPQVFDNLHFLETKMFQLREKFLQDGYVFDKYETGHPLAGRQITLDLVLSEIGGPENLPHAGAWAATQEFRALVKEDFDHYKNKQGYWTTEHGHKVYKTYEEGQFREFIYTGDYNHGFTLWDGDAPKDEFNMAATGPTGGFIRRARENKDVGEANVLISGLLSDLKYIQTPDQAFKHPTEIYSKIQSYDAHMAKETMVYLTEGLLKFYGSTGVTNAPIIGMIVENYPGLIPALIKAPYKIPKEIGLIPFKVFLGTMRALGKNDFVNKWDEKMQGMSKKVGELPGISSVKDFDQYFTGSFAQQVFEGKRAAVWRAYEKHYLVQHLLAEKGYITPEQATYLKAVSSGKAVDVGANFVSFFGPFIALAIVIFLIKEASDDV